MDTQLIEPETSPTSRAIYVLIVVCVVAVLAGFTGFTGALFVLGGRAGDAQAVNGRAAPAPTVTVTATHTVKAKPRPRVTVTERAAEYPMCPDDFPNPYGNDPDFERRAEAAGGCIWHP